MSRTKVILLVLLTIAAALAAGTSFAAKKEIAFTGLFAVPPGLPPGPPPAVCAARAGSCGSDPAVIESCGLVAGQGTGIGVFDGETFLCVNTATGEFFNAYYEIRGANGSSLYGPFFGQNVPLFPGGVPGPEGPSGFLGFGNWAVDGGTGIFEGAKTNGFYPARVSQSTAEGVPGLILLEAVIEIEKDVD